VTGEDRACFELTHRAEVYRPTGLNEHPSVHNGPARLM
jgi:hypothetical protein